MTFADLAPVCDWARKFRVAVHVGSIALEENGRLYNASVFDWRGWRASRRFTGRFICLMSMLKVRKRMRGVGCVRGGNPSPSNGGRFTGGGLVLTICYDLRFAELFLEYGRAGVDLILIPSAFFGADGAGSLGGVDASPRDRESGLCCGGCSGWRA